MNKSNTIRISAAALGVLVTTALVAGGTYAFGGRGFGGSEDVKTAIANGDYNAFVEAVGDNHPMAENMTEETFNKLSESHVLMEEGDYEGARAIKEELGLKGFGERGMHSRGMRGAGMSEEARDALSDGNYSAWLEAVGDDAKVLEIIDSVEKFERLSVAHGYMEQARVIMDELGFETGVNGRQGMRGFHDRAGMGRNVE